MVQGLDLPVAIVGVPTVRAPDGLALSSRNQYLSSAEREVAPLLQRTLIDLRDSIASGERDFDALEERGRGRLSAAGFDVDYVAVRDARTLEAPRNAVCPLRILAAARLGRARLIDNLGVDEA